MERHSTSFNRAAAARLSEKTLEVSICSQLSQRLALADVIWLGLTQREEKVMGFDVASRIIGKLMFLQFKASNTKVHPIRFARPRREFTIPHTQLMNLRRLADVFPDCVYYAFPDIGDTAELAANRDLVAQTWLLRVADIPASIPRPSNRAGDHHAYIDPPDCELRSMPAEFKLMKLIGLEETLHSMGMNSKDVIRWLKQNEYTFKGRKAYGMLLPD